MLAILGSYESLVVVTHDRHFKNIRKLLPDHERRRFTNGAGRLQLEVKYEHSVARMLEEIENVEHFSYQALSRNKPFLMSIQAVGIKIQTK